MESRAAHVSGSACFLYEGILKEKLQNNLHILKKNTTFAPEINLKMVETIYETSFPYTGGDMHGGVRRAETADGGAIYDVFAEKLAVPSVQFQTTQAECIFVQMR